MNKVFSLKQATSEIAQYQADLELDRFEDALEALEDCFDLISDELKLAYLMYKIYG